MINSYVLLGEVMVVVMLVVMVMMLVLVMMLDFVACTIATGRKFVKF